MRAAVLVAVTAGVGSCGNLDRDPTPEKETPVLQSQQKLWDGPPPSSVNVGVNCQVDGCVFDSAIGQWKYVFANENDYYRVLYFGVHNHSASGNRRCDSSVRRAMAQQLQASSRYAWRVRDADSVGFVQSVGVPPQFALQPTYKAGTGQQSNPYCNAGDVGTDHVTKGIHLGFDDSESPSTGPNWNTRIGESDFADLDPVRVTCQDSDETCQADGTNGLVRSVFVPSLSAGQKYPVDECDPGSVDLEFNAGPYVGYFGRCGDGSPSLAGGCVIGYKSCSGTTPCHLEDGSIRTTGRSYNCLQRSFPGAPGFCWILAPQDGMECRGANNWVRNADGSLATESSLGVPRQVVGGGFRNYATPIARQKPCRFDNDITQMACATADDDVMASPLPYSPVLLFRRTNGDLGGLPILGAEPGSETPQTIISVPQNWKVVGTADFNDNGQGDILWKRDDGLVTVWEMNGLSIVNLNLPGGSFAPAIQNPSPRPFLGNFNGSSTTDILWQGWRPSKPGDPSEVGGSGTTWVMSTWTMTPGTAAPTSTATSLSTTSRVAAVGQFDGSGSIDQFRRGTSWSSSFRINGGVINPGPTVGPDEEVAAVGDFNGDGTSDLAWHNKATGDVSIWRIQAGSYGESPFYIRIPLDWKIVGAGDLDLDGTSDLIWRHNNGTMTVWLFSNFQVKDWGGSGFFVPTDWEWNGILETAPQTTDEKFCCRFFYDEGKTGSGCNIIIDIPGVRLLSQKICERLGHTYVDCSGSLQNGQLTCF